MRFAHLAACFAIAVAAFEPAATLAQEAQTLAREESGRAEAESAPNNQDLSERARALARLEAEIQKATEVGALWARPEGGDGGSRNPMFR